MVACRAKAFEHERGMVVIRYHCRTPVLRLVHSSEDDFSVLDIKPCIDRDPWSPQDEIHSDQVSEHQRACRRCNGRFAAGLEYEDQPPERNGRDDLICSQFMLALATCVDHVEFARTVIEKSDDLASEEDVIASGLNVF